MPTLTAHTLAVLGNQTADARFEQLHHRGVHGRFGARIDELGAWDRLEFESDRKSFSGSVRIGQHPDMAGVNVVAYNEDDDPVLSIDTGTVADHFGPDKGNNFEGDYSIVRTQEVKKLHKALAGASAAAAEGRPFTAIIEGEDAGDIRVDAAGDIAAPRVNVTAYDWNKRPKTDEEVFDEAGGYDPYPPPDREDYDSDEEYQQAVRDYPANLAEDEAEWKALVLEDYRKIPKAPTASLTLPEAAQLSEETQRLLTAPPVGAADAQTAAALHEFCRTPLHPGPCEGWKLAQAAGRDHTVRHDDLVAERRGRKRTAKPKTPKPAAAVSSEIQAPDGAGVQHESLPIPDHVPAPPGVVAARERQANIDHARARADLLAELEEVALLNEAPPDVITHRAEQTARRLGIADAPELAPVLEAARSGDPDRIQTAIATAAAGLGLHKLDDGRMVPYDRSRHKNLGSGGRPGQMMHVVRPGYAATLPGGERVQLEKTVVEEATPQEVMAERARLSPAAIGPAKLSADFEARIDKAAREQDALDSAGGRTIDGSVQLRRDPGWSPDQERERYAALRAYGADARPINQFLRTGEGSTEVAQQVKAIDDVLAKSPLSDDAELWRGVQAFDEDMADRVTSGEGLVGYEWADDGFTSTTARRRFAETEGNGPSYAGTPGPGIVMRILAPKGTGSVQLSTDTYEAEVLLPRDLRFRVVADHGLQPPRRPGIGVGFRRIDVEILPPAIAPANRNGGLKPSEILARARAQRDQTAATLVDEVNFDRSRMHEFCRNPLHPGPCKGWKGAKAAGLDHSVTHQDLTPAMPKKSRQAKPKPPPRAEPAANTKAAVASKAGSYTGPTFKVTPQQRNTLKKLDEMTARWKKMDPYSDESFDFKDEIDRISASSVSQALTDRIDQETRINNGLEDLRSDMELDGDHYTKAQLKSAMAKQLAKEFGGKKIAVRVTPKALERILGDGRFKSQHETGKGGAVARYVPESRRRLEAQLYGIPNTTEFPASKRPISGYVAVNGIGPADEDHWLSQHGRVQVILKDTVRDRTTAMIGDTLDDKHAARPSPVNAPEWESYNRYFLDDAHGAAGRSLNSQHFRVAGYAEANIHNGLPVSDIEEIVFPDQPDPKMRDKLEKEKIPWRVIPSRPPRD